MYMQTPLDPGLWYMGGTIGQSRYYSRFVALQIKAAMLRTPLPVFDEEIDPCQRSESLVG
jgi:hypothetical protein